MSGHEMLLERVRAATADEYEIERQIGRGGMAAVFLARDIALDRPVAIKVMRPDLIDVEGIQDRFVIEARTAAQLDHPGIVTMYAVRQRAGLLYIAMKYIEGRTLESVLKTQRQLGADTAAAIGARVAEALHFAHGEGVVHRDVKPSNIMIDTRGRPVVTDFGIARLMSAQSITAAGAVVGTPTYMSPEQCRGLPATTASDQYSLGVTIYEMLTGQTPFSGSMFELLGAHRDQSPRPIRHLAPSVDSELEETVMRMLEKDPGQRWGSLAEVAQRLSPGTPSGVSWDTATHDRAGTPGDGANTSGGGIWTTPGERPAIPSIEAPVDRAARMSRLLMASAAALLVTLVVFLGLWSRGGLSSGTEASRPDSLPRPDTTAQQTVQTPPPETTAVSTPPPAPPETAAAPVVTKNTPSPARRRDSTRVRRIPPESIAVECARLLERVSLGERLTQAESELLRRSCQRRQRRGL